jgi:hypothetical protein
MITIRSATELAIQLQRRDDRIRRVVADLAIPPGVDADDSVQVAQWRRLRIDAMTAQQSRSVDDWLAYRDTRARFVARYGEVAW